jgi:citrate synthase
MSTVASEPQVISGLEGVLACESTIASIDGPNGVLTYRGYNIRDFADSADFLAVTHLLWEGAWPTSTELASFQQSVQQQRALLPQIHTLLSLVPAQTTNPMAIVRTAISLHGALDPTADDVSRPAVLDKATRVLASLPTLIAAMSRMTQGLRAIAPNPSLGHAANYLYMLRGSPPSDGDAQALNSILTLYAEHELNASTFASRTVVGTLSDYYSALVAGVAAIKGPLHGGAVDDAMKLFREIGSPDNVVSYMDQALAERRKLPGFGHRVYRTRDPRAYHLERIAKRLGEEAGETDWFEIATRVEHEMVSRKHINANVDYFAALALYHLGFPLNMFTSVIVSSRVVGWTAHILEQYANNRLIRPRALYRGPTGRSYPATGGS